MKPYVTVSINELYSHLMTWMHGGVPFTGCLNVQNLYLVYLIEGRSRPRYDLKDGGFVVGQSHCELDLLKYLYKNDPSPELMAAIMELDV